MRCKKGFKHRTAFSRPSYIRAFGFVYGNEIKQSPLHRPLVFQEIVETFYGEDSHFNCRFPKKTFEWICIKHRFKLRPIHQFNDALHGCDTVGDSWNAIRKMIPEIARHRLRISLKQFYAIDAIGFLIRQVFNNLFFSHRYQVFVDAQN